MAHDWPRPSPGAAELIRAATTQILLEPEDLFAEVDAAVLASQPDQTVADAQVAAAIRTSNRANLAHWAASNLRDPGARVPPLTGPETLEIAREVVRRGMDDTSLEAYRVGQNIAWRQWMRVAFSLGADPEPLGEMLDVTARSIFTFVDETLAAIHEAMEDERAQLGSRTHTERMEIVNLILEHAPITVDRASRRLRYELGRRHTAFVAWSDVVGPRDPGALEAVAEAVTRAAGGRRPLTVAPSASSLWGWFASTGELDVAAIRAAVPDHGVRVALGSSASGLHGFRTSHLQALKTQALMRRMPTSGAFATWTDVRLVVLATQDEEEAAEFVAATLGGLADADPALRETLRIYLRHGESTARAARALYAHRNTVTGRLARARELLGVPLEENALEVGLALEIGRWLGPR